MNDKPKICAVVVSYNRKDLLIECLEALLKQTRPIEGIYIIDNESTDGTPEILKDRGYITEMPPDNLKEAWEKEFEVENLTDKNKVKIYYVRMDKNTGGAGGFYEGVKRGYERGYDWLWLMDDDAEPKFDALEKTFSYMQTKGVVVISNLKVSKDGSPQYIHRGWKDICNINNTVVKYITDSDITNKEFLEIDFSSFVGFMISRDGISKAGFPKKEFFLHCDDLEYSFRVRKYGKILLITKSIIYHKDVAKSNVEYKEIYLRKSVRVPFQFFWLRYFVYRNLVYLKKHECGFSVAFLCAFKNLIRMIFGIMLYDDYKFRRIKLITLAFINGLSGNFDNELPKRVLYKNIKSC